VRAVLQCLGGMGHQFVASVLHARDAHRSTAQGFSRCIATAALWLLVLGESECWTGPGSLSTCASSAYSCPCWCLAVFEACLRVCLTRICCLYRACRTTVAAAVATVAVEAAMVVAAVTAAVAMVAAAVMVAAVTTTGAGAMTTGAVVATGTASAGAAQHQAAAGAAPAAGAGKLAYRGGAGTAGVMLACSAAKSAQHIAGATAVASLGVSTAGVGRQGYSRARLACVLLGASVAATCMQQLVAR
jgi:hypothetical protein